MRTCVRVLGIGNDFRGDDAAGLLCIRRLRETLGDKHLAALEARGIRIEESGGEAAALMEAWQGADLVILVDAVQSGSPPGTIHELDAGDSPLLHGVFRASTHAFGLAEAVEMARVLGRLPHRLHLCGVEIGSLAPGSEPCGAVRKAVETVVHRILTLLPPL